VATGRTVILSPDLPKKHSMPPLSFTGRGCRMKEEKDAVTL